MFFFTVQNTPLSGGECNSEKNDGIITCFSKINNMNKERSTKISQYGNLDFNMNNKIKEVINNNCEHTSCSNETHAYDQELVATM